MTLANQDAITRFLAGKGLTAAQIAGVEGNLQIESNGSPTAYNAREGAIGLAQWEGGRRTGANGLQAFARSAGTSETDLTTQLNFMWQELQTSEHGALTALLAATTPAAAAQAFQSKYERSSTSSLPARINAATAIAAGGLQGGSGQVAAGGGGAGVQSAGFDWNPLNWPSEAMGVIGRVLVDALIVLVGAVLLIVAVVLLAKAGGSGSSTTVQLVPAAAGKGGGAKSKSGAKGGSEGAAEDAAEVAA